MEDKMGGKSKDKFIDRSKVRILLCDNDNKSCDEVFSLLSNCSYQVTTVRSARQVIDALNAEGPSIDIILSEVDIPMKKGLKLLKYIMRDKDLQRIPVIMMSAQDEVSLVVKCLRLGAADYLVKPLRSNELLNVWTHMWRRRRMLGLAEKNMVAYDFNLVASDHSDANTNSTTLFSDDTDDKSRKNVNPEMIMSVQQEHEYQSLLSNKATPESVLMNSFLCRPGVPGISDRRTGQSVSFPKKSELKIGEGSAFLTYVKSNTAINNCQPFGKTDCQAVLAVDIECNSAQPSHVEDKSETRRGHVNNGNITYENKFTWENHIHGEVFPKSGSAPGSTSMEKSFTQPVAAKVQTQPRTEANFDVSGLAGHSSFPYYIPGMTNQVMMPSAHLYQKDLPGHGASSMMSHYSHLPHWPSHAPGGMTPFTYYPVNMGAQPSQLPANQHGQGTEASLSKVDRREAALIKFRRKRKERCFDKKIRYVNRKKLAERRPRVRGQFVRKVNGISVDLNGYPSPIDLDAEDEDDYDPTSRDLSPEDVTPR